jgi:hypothetical protein
VLFRSLLEPLILLVPKDGVALEELNELLFLVRGEDELVLTDLAARCLLVPRRLARKGGGLFSIIYRGEGRVVGG